MQKIKKILFVASLYAPHVGGIETMIKELSRLYINMGYHVSVLTKKWPKDLVDIEKIDGVNVYRVVSARTEEDFFNLVTQVLKHEHELKSDIIHVIGIRRPLPFIALMLARRWGVPVVQTIAGGDIPDVLDPNPGLVWDEGKEFIPQTLLQSDSINAVSRYMAITMLGLMPEIRLVDTLYAGINLSDIKRITPENIDKKYIFSLRRLDPSKGIDILIKAFKIIAGEFPDLYLLIAGEGTEKQYLERLVVECALEKRVKFIGTVSLEKGIALLKSAVLTVVPSLSEGGGLVNIEAQAAGCPVVASNVGGIPEYVLDNYSGLLFHSGNIDDLVRQIRRVIVDKKLRDDLIAGGYEYAEKFDWKSLVPQYIDIYQETIKKHDIHKAFKPWSDITSNIWKKLNI